MLSFHRNVYLPDAIRLPVGEHTVKYSSHALDEAKKDRAGNLTGYLPARLDLAAVNVVEVKTDDHLRPQTVVCRQPAKTAWDIVMVVNLNNWLVVTCWANRSSDHHNSLRRERYVPPPY